MHTCLCEFDGSPKICLHNKLPIGGTGAADRKRHRYTQRGLRFPRRRTLQPYFGPSLPLPFGVAPSRLAVTRSPSAARRKRRAQRPLSVVEPGNRLVPKRFTVSLEHSFGPARWTGRYVKPMGTNEGGALDDGRSQVRRGEQTLR